MNSTAGSHALGNQRAFRTIGYVLVFLMIVCLVTAISRLLHVVMPEWRSDIIAGVMLLVVLERLFLHQRFKSLDTFGSEWAITHGTQWIVFALVIRLLLSYAKGRDAFLADLVRFAQGYIDDLFSPDFVVALLLAMLAWSLVAMFLDLLDEIGLAQVLALGAEPSWVQSDAVSAHRRLVNLIFSLGIFLVILTALGRVNLGAGLFSSPGSPRVELSDFSAGEAGALLYFILGLALLAQGRLMSLQTRWNVQRIPISSHHLARQWALYSLIFLFVIILAVSLLPTGDSLGIFSILGMVINFLWNVLFFFWQLIVSLIFLLFSLPFLLLGNDPPVEPNVPSPPVLTPEPMQSALPPESSALWMLLRSILLWAVLLMILGFSLRHFFRQHDHLMATVRKAPVVRWLILAWQWLRKSAERTRTEVSRAIAEGWQSLVARLEGRRSLSRPGWISLRGLDPRRRIYFFYLAMVRRSGEQGLPRKPAQTPSEYAGTLQNGLPDSGEDIEQITRSFMEARYSGREVDAQEADVVKAIWGRIRRALQQRFKGEAAGKK